MKKCMCPHRDWLGRCVVCGRKKGETNRGVEAIAKRLMDNAVAIVHCEHVGYTPGDKCRQCDAIVPPPICGEEIDGA